MCMPHSYELLKMTKRQESKDNFLHLIVVKWQYMYIFFSFYSIRVVQFHFRILVIVSGAAYLCRKLFDILNQNWYSSSYQELSNIFSKFCSKTKYTEDAGSFKNM